MNERQSPVLGKNSLGLHVLDTFRRLGAFQSRHCLNRTKIKWRLRSKSKRILSSAPPHKHPLSAYREESSSVFSHSERLNGNHFWLDHWNLTYFSRHRPQQEIKAKNLQKHQLEDVMSLTERPIVECSDMAIFDA